MTRSDDETARLAEAHRHRGHMTRALAELDRKIESIVTAIEQPPQESGFTSAGFAEVLTDAELIALDTWIEGTSEILSTEVRRRAAHHQEQARRLAASRGDVELVTLLAERVQPAA